MITNLLLASAQISPSATAAPPADQMATSEPEILITASLVPVATAQAPASATVFDQRSIDALGLTGASDLVRLAPGISVSTSGARGTETVVRIRGAESNHTLIFVDGIAFNDIAAANAARFDTLPAAGLERIELVRGPQSALWGSEALGGVVALSSPDPLGTPKVAAVAELGTRDSRRIEAEFTSGGRNMGLSATGNWTRSDGIDILGGGLGDRDGFDTRTLGLKTRLRRGDVEAGFAGRYIHHRVHFDGFDPATFARADTADSAIAETVAGRIWLGFDNGSRWSARLEAQHLDSENRNRVGSVRTADTQGRRTRFGGRLSRRLDFGMVRHDLILAVEREEEAFSTRQFGGAAVDRLHRSRNAFVAEWRSSWSQKLTTDVAVRYDDFSRFADSTTLRLNAVWSVGSGFQLLAGYGEGIAQPSFTDLFGFPGFPFAGNPLLEPERSTGYEAGIRWRSDGLTIEGVLFSNDLEAEIVEDFSVFPATVINASADSRRRGIELTTEWRPAAGFRLSANYTFLQARQDGPSGDQSVEIRRPKHSANIYADWRNGPLTAGASLSYVGRRIDRDFDLFPAPVVRLGDYWLSTVRLAYRLLPELEFFGRVENGFDARYQDVFGYVVPGRSFHAGIRVASGL